jgi:superfamily II DNA or RNA helicase
MLILICGVGKTLISLWITIKLNLNKILIGVPNTLLLEQWEEVIKGNEDYYGVIPDIEILIVDKDCNKDKIIKFLKDNEKCIVITTYHSSNKILDAINESNYIFDIKINDECHHLTTSDMKLANTRKAFVHMLSIKSKKQISLTATLKQIEISRPRHSQIIKLIND